MTINLSAPQTTELKPRIVVIGVGGAGGNAVNNMITSGLEGVDFIVANTDAQALAGSQAERRIQLGASITQGLGCGARPDIGRAAAEEAIDHILDHMSGTHMAFITAGMGGGTGTGAAPVVAESLRDQGILTVGVVTKPFHFEGTHRMTIAEKGIEELQAFVDTLIIIPNQNLFRIANEKTTFADAFTMADNVLHSGVRGITDLMVQPGLINLDFADVKTVMAEMGKAMMGTGEAEGEKRALDAAEAAISNPLLDDVSMRGARGVLINISGGMDLTLYEVDEAANRIREEVDPEANIIVGSALDDALNGRMRVSVVATGIEVDAMQTRPPVLKPRLAAVAGRTLGEDEPAEDGDVPTAAAPTAGEPAMAAPQPTEPSLGAAPQMSQPAPPPSMSHGAGEATAAAPVQAAMPGQAQAAAVAAVEEPEMVEDLLTLSASEQVPPPKPMQPTPELVDVPATAAPQAADEAPFIAPEPTRPANRRAATGRPDPMSEAEAVNAGRRSEPKRSRGFSLFRRMTGASAEPAVETVPPAPAPQAAPAAPEAPAAPAPEQATAPSLKAPEPTDRLGTLSEEEDLLEIPSFLRRQAN